ncbi:MAG: methyl-accepting chemotaxis protein [Bryobacteraceae bacterium]|nr:MCP four helix bundle domain-containing protein [Solibacteraceae bacterium]MCO5352049.1 methyl-accepting chemotaxis protein [Bryobacteraceae bacterium]
MNKMAMGTKLLSVQSLLAAFLLLLGGFGVYSVRSFSGIVEQLAVKDARKTEIISQVDARAQNLVAAMRGLMLSGLTGDAAGVAEAEKQSREALDKMGILLDEGRTLLVTGEGKVRWEKLDGILEQYRTHSGVLLGHLREQRFDEANTLQRDRIAPLLAETLDHVAWLVDAQQKILAGTTADADSRASMLMVLMLVLCGAAAAVVAFGFRTVWSSNRDLRGITVEIAKGASQVASAAQQVSSASQSMAQGSSEQAASLEETSASTEEINAMTQKNAENARNAATEVEQVDRMLKETNRKLEEMIGSMREINASSEKISKIIKVIDEIAFQTNILALNAAVEAARAGEAGMGFAVVADEVRNLAQRSAQAARDTSELIEESIVRSNEGKTKLDEVAAWVTKVVQNAAQINVLTNEVHVGSQEQARGIEQIAKAVTQMQSLTQSSAANAEESASAGEMMSEQATALNGAVMRLRDLVGSADEQAEREPVRTKPVSVKQPAPAPAALAAPRTRDSFPMEGDFKDF